jgi:hypothetical protein
MLQIMWTYRTITNNPYAYFNAEMLLVSRMDCTVRVLLWPLVLVMNIDDAFLPKSAYSVKINGERKRCSALRALKLMKKI